jgi:hypothetical protein
MESGRENQIMTTPFTSALEEALVRDPVCGLGAIAEAFAEASARSGSCEELRRALDSRAEAIDVLSARVAFRRLIGVLALKTGETPRSILEEEFAKAPSDDFWRGSIGGRA